MKTLTIIMWSLVMVCAGLLIGLAYVPPLDDYHVDIYEGGKTVIYTDQQHLQTDKNGNLVVVGEDRWYMK